MYAMEYDYIHPSSSLPSQHIPLITSCLFFIENPLIPITITYMYMGTILPPPTAITWQQFLHSGRGLENTSTKDELTASSILKGFPAAKHTCVVYTCAVYMCVHMHVEMCLSVYDLVEARG